MTAFRGSTGAPVVRFPETIETSALVKETRKLVKETSKLVKETSKLVKETSKLVKETSKLVKETQSGRMPSPTACGVYVCVHERADVRGVLTAGRGREAAHQG